MISQISETLAVPLRETSAAALADVRKRQRAVAARICNKAAAIQEAELQRLLPMFPPDIGPPLALFDMHGRFLGLGTYVSDGQPGILISAKRVYLTINQVDPIDPHYADQLDRLDEAGL